MPGPVLDGLGAVSSVLAVCAHPDDESFGLGAVLHRLAAQGCRTSVLCFTHGEASTLGPFATGLREIRENELRAAAGHLGVDHVEMLDHPDGALPSVPLADLVETVQRAVDAVDADLLLVFDEGGVTGHADHRRATEAALAAGEDLPVLAWGLPASVSEALNAEFDTGFVGRDERDFDMSLTVDRVVQRRAIDCHRTQSSDNPVLWRRLELLGETESLRWLRPRPQIDAAAVAIGAKEAEMSGAVHVSHMGGDRFEIRVRQHRLEVDQPVSDGGEDTAPTPTELFVASLTACVGFYARRYLVRHDLPTEGLAVDASFTMAARPARVGDITIRVDLPEGVPEEKRAALLAVASHCTVHNTLTTPPTVTIELASAQSAAA